MIFIVYSFLPLARVSQFGSSQYFQYTYIFSCFSVSLSLLLIVFCVCATMAFDRCVPLCKKISTGRRYGLSHFQIVVHIETSFGDVIIIDFDSLFLRVIRPLLDYLFLIEIFFLGLILLDIPRQIITSSILICNLGRHERFGIVHLKIK
jgi:hypothetical protein